MSDDRCLAREIPWRDLFPWMILFRTFRLAIHPPLLMLATAGALLTPVGWLLPAAGQEELEKHFVQVVEFNWSVNMDDYQTPSEEADVETPAEEAAAAPPSGSFTLNVLDTGCEFVWTMITPFRSLFDAELKLSGFGYVFSGTMWTLLVWAFFGGAITRVAVVRLGREERIGLWEAVCHASRHLGHYFTAPLYPLLGVALLTTPLLFLGWLMRLDFGVVIAGILWALVLPLGFASAVLLAGLLFGWPLMWVAISAEERRDAFEGLHHSYAYTLQSPLHYLFYAVLALLLGLLGWLCVWGFSEAVVALTYWGVSWGAGAERLPEIRKAPLISFWVTLVRVIVAGFVYSYFWCAASGVYLLLRRDVDETEFDEVFMPEDEEVETLPPLQRDEAGVPTVAEEEEQKSEDAGEAASDTAPEQ